MTHRSTFSRQRGASLIELMVTLAITLFLVAAAAYVYLGTRESQRALDRSSSDTEVGTFVLQLIGQEIMMAGFYPATTTALSLTEKFPKLTYYPPVWIAGNDHLATDWTLPAPVYASGIFGCDGAPFNPTTGTCGTTVTDAPDSIVINYFTNDTMGSNIGHRFDCTGADVGNDATNTNRIGPAGPAPRQPLFVSNRYTITTTRTAIDNQTITTGSLACNGNGASGSKPNPDTAVTTSGGSPANNRYQPMIAGIEDLQITYGVFAATANQSLRTPDKFYTATQVNDNLLPLIADNPPFYSVLTPPWSRVVAVRVCVMTKSLGANPKIADKSSAQQTYTDCNGATKTPLTGDNSVRKRFVQVFAVRNRLNQTF